MPNFENLLAEAIRTRPDDDGITTSQGFNRVAAEWLGYDLDPEAFVDGAGDLGVDFWFSHSTGFDIVQTKMHELAGDGTINHGRFNSHGMSDLQRARTFLISDENLDLKNKGLQELKSKWDFELSGRRKSQKNDPLVVNLILVVLGDGLTTPAQSEFDAFGSSLEEIVKVGEVDVQFRTALYTLDTLIDTRWREQNRDWRDKSGTRREHIHLTPWEEKWIGSSKDVVFYCPAIELVRAYEDFGYQIFEPNVRAQIRKSKVNSAIEESVQSRISRHEFRLLNNGVTITCSGYSNPNQNRAYFNVREPGIVNGLQTVVALHSGYQKLSQTEKVDFEANCLVLVRVLQQNAVVDIGQVVLATNNQNRMEPRNLMSNRSEQIYYEKLFAEIGWFYERKQGAWDAFSADYQRWRTLSNKRPKNFKTSSGQGRPKYKRLDNEDLAQTWLAFVGFSSEAVNYKKDLFDEKWYEFIFLRQLPNHASDFDFHLDHATADAIRRAPDENLMLLSWLAREMARAAAPSPKSARDEAMTRLRLDKTRKSKEEITVALADDLDYTLSQVLRGSSFLFVELLGYVLYRALGNPNDRGIQILRKGIGADLKDNFDLDDVVARLRNDEFDQSDVIAVVWKAFLYNLENLLSGSWRDSYRAATVKSRFLFSIETRRRFMKEFDELDRFLMSRELARVWATGIKPGEGLYGFVRSSLSA